MECMYDELRNSGYATGEVKVDAVEWKSMTVAEALRIAMVTKMRRIVLDPRCVCVCVCLCVCVCV